MKVFKKNGFTLIEVLIVIGIIASLTTLVIVAINPARHFAQTRNTQRLLNIRTILEATGQYAVDGRGVLPPGINETLKMIGTASSGCDVSCGGEFLVMQNDSDHYKYSDNQKKDNHISFVPWAYAVQEPEKTSKESEVPQIILIEVKPNKVLPGDKMLITVEVNDSSGVKKVMADMDGIEKLELKLKKGNIFSGVWEAVWTVHNTENKQYITTVTVVNNSDLFSQKKIGWSDPLGWVLPTGYEDPGNQWQYESKSYDGDTGTYAQNNYGGSGWGQFIVLTLSAPINSDRVRVNADYLNSHIREVDVDVLKDGVWVDVFQGGDEQDWNCKWVEIIFTEGLVEKARFRYNYRVSGYYYWLYEFQFYEKSNIINYPVCNTREASSIEEDRAVLQGILIEDGGEPCQYRFQYGKTEVYGSNTEWKNSKITGNAFSELILGLDNDVKYHFRAQVKNSVAITDGSDQEFLTKQSQMGWVLPVSHIDPDNKWENENSAYDDNISTLARSYHNMGDPQWSSFLYFNRSGTKSNKIKFYARAGGQVNAVDVDVLKDGIWVDVFQGSFADKQWEEKIFDQGIVTQARIRFSAANNSQGFYWEVYEFNFFKTNETTAGVCLDLSGYLTPDYISKIPYDPIVGSPERTYYAIKLTAEGRLAIKACETELGEKINIIR